MSFFTQQRSSTPPLQALPWEHRRTKRNSKAEVALPFWLRYTKMEVLLILAGEEPKKY